MDEVSLREWILFAVVEEDPASKVYYDDIAKINKLIDGIDFNLLKIPKLEFLDQDGKPYPIEKARAEREGLYNLLSAQRTTAEEDLELAERNLKNHNDWRRSMGVELIKGEEDKNTDTCTWFVRLYGTDDAKELEDLLIEKEDWPGIKLACGVKNHDPPIPPWTGRSTSPPDGTKVQDLTDYTLLQVNIAGARIARIPAGVGLIQQLDRGSSNIYAEEFGIFYGSFESGRKSGYGIEIDDIGVYAGAYEDGGKRGRGRLDLADGTTITATFGVKLQRKVPECKAFINPYKEGEPNGQVEVLFSDGGYYRGNMENGRIQGQGDYQSAMNEVVSGTFMDGILHGEKGFIQNQIEDVYMGTFRHGELHGRGVYQNKRGDSYEGYWMHNMRHGRGVANYTRSGCYRGYFVNNIKHGKGSLEYGYSKDRVLGKKKKADQSTSPKKDPATSKEAPGDGNSDKKSGSPAKSNASPKTKKKDAPLPTASSMQAAAEEEALARDLSEFNTIYQGYFFGGNISNKGCTMNTRIQMPGIISRLDPRATYGITKVLKREERQQKSANHSVERFNDIEGHIRDEIQRKKIKIFNQQKHFTKKTMYAADVYGLSQGAIHEFESKLHLRKERLNNLTEDNHLYKKALVPRLRIPNNASNEFLRKAFERIKPDANEVDPAEQVDENVLKILLSDFEEVQERQRFLKYDRIWQRAEDAYVGNRSAAV